MPVLHATYPCGCVAWRYGRDAGVNKCASHHLLHLKLLEVAILPSEVDCGECLECRARHHNRDPYEYVRDRISEQVAYDRPKLGEPDRDDKGDMVIDVDACGCCWGRFNGVWRLPAPCLEHHERVQVQELDRNHRR